MTSRSYRYNVPATYSAILPEVADRPALVRPHGRTVTHGELNELANRVAAVLVDGGIGRSDVVAIVHTKSDECYAAMLACLKIGAIYVNIDDQNPVPRLEHIFSAARPKLVLGHGLPANVAAVAQAGSIACLDFAETAFSCALMDASNGERVETDYVTGSDPAYIMFTSGSTGVPKGAIMTHDGLLNLSRWAKQRFGITPDDVLTNVNPMYFDNSVFDFYGAIPNGAAIVPVTREVVSDAPAMLEQLEAAAATIWFSVPSLLIYLGTMKLLSPERLRSIRTFSFGGEGYPKPELRKLFDAYASRSRLINVYGPTECTCICSAWDVSAVDFEDMTGLVTLGPVAENFSMIVLDGHDLPVDLGAVGELCLMGPQVGLGYVGDPERTARSFQNNPANGRWPERMYRTGDLVRLAEDGRKLDFVGRKDNQIKHMGYRIELEEIEAALHLIEGVSEAAVVHIAARRSAKMLVAFVAADRDYSEEQVRRRLAEILPPYMIPQRVEFRSILPKNANGKVDRRTLAESGS